MQKTGGNRKIGLSLRSKHNTQKPAKKTNDNILSADSRREARACSRELMFVGRRVVDADLPTS